MHSVYKMYTYLFFFYCGIIRLLELDYKFKDLCIIKLILGWFFFFFNSFICMERKKKKKMIRTMFKFFFFFQVSLVGLEEFMGVIQTHNGYHLCVTVLALHTLNWGTLIVTTLILWTISTNMASIFLESCIN